MVEATLGLTTLGECVQAFQLATGVHVGRDVHALVDGVHIFAETGHVLQGASGWLEIVEGTIDLRQNSMVHVSIFPRRSGSTNHVTVGRHLCDDQASLSLVSNMGAHPDLLRHAWASMSPADLSEVLTNVGLIPVTRHNLLTLCDGQWLDDEIINHFLELTVMKLRAVGVCDVHIFSTLFYAKLTHREYNYSGVQRWTPKHNSPEGDIFNKRMVIFPIHIHGDHWVLAVLYVSILTIHYYDSLSDSCDANVCNNLRQWVGDEMYDKRGVRLDTTSDCIRVIKAPGPRQTNGHDCGMFTVLTASRLAASSSLEDLQQVRIPGMRMLMACELATRFHSEYQYISRFESLAFGYQ